MMPRISEFKKSCVKFMPLSLSFISDVSKIEKECFSEPWSEKSILEEFNNQNSYFVVATLENDIIGYAGMYCVCDEGYIYNIAVRKQYRGLGVGKRLLICLEDYSKQNKLKFLTLEVRNTNNIAINLYEKSLFTKVGVRKDFYSNPKEDAIIMTKYF